MENPSHKWDGRESARSDAPKLHLALADHAEFLRCYITRKIPRQLRSLLSTEDVLQEVWISAFRGIAGFKPNGPDAFSRWLMTIAERRLVDKIREARALRRGGGRLPFQEADAHQSSLVALYTCAVAGQRTPSREASAKEMSRAVRMAIAALPNDQRQVVQMRHIEGLSVAEIAVAVKRTKSSVHGLLHRGLCRLGEELGDASRFLSWF